MYAMTSCQKLENCTYSKFKEQSYIPVVQIGKRIKDL